MSISPASGAFDSDLATQKARIIDRTIQGVAIALVPVAAIILYFQFANGWSLTRGLQVAAFVPIWGLALAQGRVSQSLRACVIMLLLLGISASEILDYGLVAAPMFLLATIPILATAGFGTRQGFVSLGLILGMLAVIGWVTVSGEHVPPVSLPDFFYTPAEWIVRLLNFAIAVSIGVIITGYLYRYHTKANRALQARNAELTHSRSRNQQAAELAALGYAVTDEREGRFLECDHAYAAMHGRTVDEMMAMDIGSDVIGGIVCEADRATAAADRERLMHGEALTSELGHLLPDGELRYIRKIFTPRQTPAGPGHLYEIVSQDVTEARRLQEHIFQTQKVEAIGNLTGGVAHDFNNLLAVIMGNLELLHDDLDSGKLDPKEAGRLIDTCIGATVKGADLTRNMLSFARRARLEPSVLQLNDLVRDAKVWIGRTLPANIDVETSLLAGLWRIEADRSSTESAFLNLILNARDAMPGGGKLTIETANVRIDDEYIASRYEDIAPGRYVMLAVSDTGEGIAEPALQHIFEPFFTTKAPGAGSGLGLSMIQGFMKQSGGAVRVYSEPGQGTTFKLYFKAFSGDAPPDPLPDPEQLPQGLAGKRILVAEDEPNVLGVLQATLQNVGYVVVPAASGDQAKALFMADPSGFDLLLTDIIMPGHLQGTTLARVLREIAPTLPVVFMSGYANEATVHGNGLRPEDSRLMKPIRRKELLAAVAKALTAAL